MSFLSLLEGVRDTINTGVEHMQFRRLFSQDRSTACDYIASVVPGMTPDELCAFDQALVIHGIAVVGPAHRFRAMELYAFFKMQETIHHGFRGFPRESGPLE